MSQSHQWFVTRGRLGISREGSEVHLELDPEGSAYCVLSAQDAGEVAGIVANEARAIWDASDKVNSPAAQVDGDVHASCELQTSSGVLQAMVHDSKPYVALAYDSPGVCRLNVAQAVALVQILERMAAAIESKAT